MEVCFIGLAPISTFERRNRFCGVADLVRLSLFMFMYASQKWGARVHRRDLLYGLTVARTCGYVMFGPIDYRPGFEVAG